MIRFLFLCFDTDAIVMFMSRSVKQIDSSRLEAHRKSLRNVGDLSNRRSRSYSHAGGAGYRGRTPVYRLLLSHAFWRLFDDLFQPDVLPAPCHIKM
jgi:hypothetical protein